MSRTICIFGAGGFAREVYCLIVDLGRRDEVYGFMDADRTWQPGKLNGVPVRPESEFDPDIHTAVIAAGDPRLREKIVSQLPAHTRFETLVHPSAVLSEWVETGEGAVICAGVILTCDIRVGRHAHLNLNTTVGHDCVLGDFVTTAPGVNISGNCILGNRVYMGSGACIRQGLSVVDDVTIGMGGIVVKPISEPGVYAGNPVQKLT